MNGDLEAVPHHNLEVGVVVRGLFVSHRNPAVEEDHLPGAGRVAFQLFACRAVAPTDVRRLVPDLIARFAPEGLWSEKKGHEDPPPETLGLGCVVPKRRQESTARRPHKMQGRREGRTEPAL